MPEKRKATEKNGVIPRYRWGFFCWLLFLAGVRLMENFWIYFQNTLPSWAGFTVLHSPEILHLSFILIVIYFMVAACNAWLSSGIANVSMYAARALQKITTRFLDFIEMLSNSKLKKRVATNFIHSRCCPSSLSFSLFFTFPKHLNPFGLISIGLHFIMKFCGRTNTFFSFHSFRTILLSWNNCIVCDETKIKMSILDLRISKHVSWLRKIPIFHGNKWKTEPFRDCRSD